MLKTPKPLYRKVNTTAHGVHHRFGGDFSDTRNQTKLDSVPHSRSMPRGVRRGLDYTPLFRFLLSRVGKAWNETFSEAVARLDQKAPIFWLVALREEDAQDYVRIGEASYFSGLKVDSDGVLQIVNPSIGPHSLVPHCPCCTHTFNGLPYTQPYQAESVPRVSATRMA